MRCDGTCGVCGACGDCFDAAMARVERECRERDEARWRAEDERAAFGRVDPFGGRAYCVVPAFYGWQERDGVRLWVTVAVWVGNRLGPWCAPGDGARCDVLVS